MNNPSDFKLISIGVVAENKLRSTPDVEITLTEVHPFISGELVAGLVQESVDCTNINGDALTFSVYTSNTIRATWKGDGTNRVTSPDVRRGEEVNVYQFGDTDKYYWEVLNKPGVTTRKLETVVTAYSNSTDPDITEPSADNSWVDEVNTHEGHRTFKTNKSNGEKFAYTAQINARDGNVVIADDAGTYIQMNSSDQHIEAETAAGARVELFKDNVIITCNDFTVNAKGKITMKGNSGEFTIPNTTWKGDLSMIGNMIGDAAGTYTFNGNVITNSEITNKGKNIGAEHTHKQVQSGNGTSGGVS